MQPLFLLHNVLFLLRLSLNITHIILHPFHPSLSSILCSLTPPLFLFFPHILFVAFTLHPLSHSPSKKKIFGFCCVSHCFHTLQVLSIFVPCFFSLCRPHGECSGLHGCCLCAVVRRGGEGGGAGRLSELPGDGLGCSSSIPSLVNVATLSLTKTATLSAGCPLKRTVAWEPAPPRHH